MEPSKKTYEGMFLLESGNPDFQAASEPVRNILTRYEAEILSLKPWDDRKLAYEIRGRKRGLYVLAYFSADPQRLAEIEHDCELDERVVRQLILRRDRITQEQINAETPATTAASRPPPEAAPPAGVPPTEPVEQAPSVEEIVELASDQEPEKA